jgi:hypothetical protein
MKCSHSTLQLLDAGYRPYFPYANLAAACALVEQAKPLDSVNPDRALARDAPEMRNQHLDLLPLSA